MRETKLNKRFPPQQIFIDDFENRARKDRNQHGGGFNRTSQKKFNLHKTKQFKT